MDKDAKFWVDWCNETRDKVFDMYLKLIEYEEKINKHFGIDEETFDAEDNQSRF